MTLLLSIYIWINIFAMLIIGGLDVYSTARNHVLIPHNRNESNRFVRWLMDNHGRDWRWIRYCSTALAAVCAILMHILGADTSWIGIPVDAYLAVVLTALNVWMTLIVIGNFKLHAVFKARWVERGSPPLRTDV